MKEYKYDPTETGRQALSRGLVCSALLFFDNYMHVSVRLTWCCWGQLVVQPLREVCPRSAHEVPETAWHFLSLTLGMLLSLLSGLDRSCWFVPGVSLMIGLMIAASSCVLSACLEDWSAAAESYLVFATGLNCWERRSNSLPKNYCWTSPLPNNFSTSFAGWWARGEVEPLLKVGFRLERWLRGQKSQLLFQRFWVQFPAPTCPLLVCSHICIENNI